MSDRRTYSDSIERLWAQVVERNERIASLTKQVERLRAALTRILHFATCDCKMGDATRLKCIAAECRAEAMKAEPKWPPSSTSS